MRGVSEFKKMPVRFQTNVPITMVLYLSRPEGVSATWDSTLAYRRHIEQDRDDQQDAHSQLSLCTRREPETTNCHETNEHGSQPYYIDRYTAEVKEE